MSLTHRLVVAVLIGVPASGKSSLALELKQFWKNGFPASVVSIVSFDEYIPNVRAYQWKDQRSDVVLAIRQALRPDLGLSSKTEVLDLCDKFRTDFSSDCAAVSIPPNDFTHVLILDDNFYYRSMRVDVFHALSPLDPVFVEVAVMADFELALKRNAGREHPVSFEVMERMQSAVEWPDAKKHTFERHSCAVTSPWAPEDLMKIVNCIKDACTEPSSKLDPEEAKRIADDRRNDQIINDSSILHRVDVILRALVKHKCELNLKGGNVGETNDAAKFFNNARREVLDNFRQMDLDCYRMDISALPARVELAFLKLCSRRH